MIALLSKFRIEFKTVKVIEILKQRLHPDVLHDFNRLIKPWRRSDADEDLRGGDRDTKDTREDSEPQEESLPTNVKRSERCFFITDAEIKVQKKRTYRQLLTRQLLIQHSFDATLIIVTLPVPRQGLSTCMYMSWLDLMTRDLPPTLLVRGNQSSVLTFYS